MKLKRLIFYILIPLLSSCSKSDPEPITYLSIEGDWVFGNVDISGEIFIVNTSGEMEIDTKGYFSISGFSNSINETSSVAFNTFSSGSIDNIQLISRTASSSIKLILRFGAVKEDYSEVTFTAYTIIRENSGGITVNAFNEDLLLRRR